MTTPNARDFELAYELLRPVPWNVRPVDHFARLIAEYRVELVTQQPNEETCPATKHSEQ